MDEIWKKIPGLRDVFEASSFGRIRRLEDTGKEDRRWSGVGVIVRIYKPRILRCSKPSKKGYLRHRIEGRTWFAHRLVASAFIDNPENLPQVNHKNGIKDDNKPQNLEWVSNQQNRDHAVVMGLIVRGERTGSAKITEEDVIKIRTSKESKKSLAKTLCISDATIDDIRARRTWRHID